MGGSVGAAIKKVTKPLKKVEGIAKAAFNPFGYVAGELSGSDALGFAVGGAGTNAAVGAAAGKAGKTFVDQPKEILEQTKKFQDEQVAANAAQLKKLKNREAQEGAEADASKDLIRKRRKQDKRKKSVGRQGTILTDSLGGAGGSDSERKTLLGK
jgi:hypothetical protein